MSDVCNHHIYHTDARFFDTVYIKYNRLAIITNSFLTLATSIDACSIIMIMIEMHLIILYLIRERKQILSYSSFFSCMLFENLTF